MPEESEGAPLVVSVYDTLEEITLFSSSLLRYQTLASTAPSGPRW